MKSPVPKIPTLRQTDSGISDIWKTDPGISDIVKPDSGISDIGNPEFGNSCIDSAHTGHSGMQHCGELYLHHHKTPDLPRRSARSAPKGIIQETISLLRE